MGMFDSINIPCPECSENVEFQSKAGECILSQYTLETCPYNILLSLVEKSETCDKCGHVVTIHMRAPMPFIT